MSPGVHVGEPSWIAGENEHGELEASSARARVGRVVEVRVRRLGALSDVESLNSRFCEAVRQAGAGAMICGDFRGASPLSREVADAWSRAMREANPGIARSALLVDPANVTFNLQIERIVRCAGNPERRVFADVTDLRTWMECDLTEREREALRAFFSSGGE
jgi:hypothetical protein